MKKILAGLFIAGGLLGIFSFSQDTARDELPNPRLVARDELPGLSIAAVMDELPGLSSRGVARDELPGLRSNAAMDELPGLSTNA
ncbi:hypothetical protein SAMN04488137_4857 [Fictibacillus solisalsi]|uniref:Uncharacterized protein n=1 Tax=Fictibacillus solisalsi TaxID=459525 RepID=A0A1H0CAX1_9BACL|nr:hypothetical protein [Fictibacillus solisalsi]SDN54983.1 hypothetical protein SAMN04488137_4857 [Fictibacillus solisalsi]